MTLNELWDHIEQSRTREIESMREIVASARELLVAADQELMAPYYLDYLDNLAKRIAAFDALQDAERTYAQVNREAIVRALLLSKGAGIKETRH